ncbi:MAG: FtsX-like permease family protein [Candidatus Moraniibacteriota bacterium]
MSSHKYILTFGARLLRREWPKYSLAFLSLFVTSVTFTVVLIGVDGAQGYLESRSREFVGGDLTLESGSPTETGSVTAPLEGYIAAADRETELNLAVRSASGVTGISARAVTESFPLYGELEIEGVPYQFPAADEIYVERAVLDRLQLSIGDELSIGSVGYRIRGIILREPDALVQGFRFAPRAILSESGLSRANIVLAESRSEYEYRHRFSQPVPEAILQSVVENAEKAGFETRIAGDGKSGFLRRLANVERFFLITVLIGAVLSSVNVYANTLSLVTRLRRSFAIFLVIGATKRAILSLVFGIIAAITLLASFSGGLIGLALVSWLYTWVKAETGIGLAVSAAPSAFALVVLGTLATSIAAAFPALRDLLSLQPKFLLSGNQTDGAIRSGWIIGSMSVVSFLPLFVLAAALLGRLDRAALSIGGTLVVFILLAALIMLILRFLYRERGQVSFFFRTIIAEKYSDGIFGTVAATSLSLALASIFTLSLMERSLEKFFETGIGTTIPNAYIIDVQKDQLSAVNRIVPRATLFPNIRARIQRIDERRIQERLRDDSAGEDRELGREFNLTYRTELLSSEEIIDGVWQGSRTGEVSVDSEFAGRVGIRLGSMVEFFVQGIAIEATVTSLRKTDTTSGLPFFYFVLHPDDVSRFPASYFGYADVTPDQLRVVERSLAAEVPNVSVLDTSAIGRIVSEVTGTVLMLLSVITFPPLLLAMLLLITLVASTFAGRRRDALRLRVLGMTRRETIRLYLAETVLTVLFVSFGAVLLAQGVVFNLMHWVLEGVDPVFLDWQILEIASGLGAALFLYALVLLRTGERNLRDAIGYEENN